MHVVDRNIFTNTHDRHMGDSESAYYITCGGDFFLIHEIHDENCVDIIVTIGWMVGKVTINDAFVSRKLHNGLKVS